MVDRVTSDNIRALRRRRLPAGCLLRIAYDDGAAPAPEAVPAAPNHFVRRGACWSVRFDGGEPFTLLPSVGAAYLHLLLSRAHAPVTAAWLACRVAGRLEEHALGSAGEVLDDDAVAAYRARCAELAEDIRRARADNDEATAAVYQEEFGALTAQLRPARGLGGRPRKAADDADRVRKAVGNAITCSTRATRPTARSPCPPPRGSPRSTVWNCWASWLEWWSGGARRAARRRT